MLREKWGPGEPAKRRDQKGQHGHDDVQVVDYKKREHRRDRCRVESVPDSPQATVDTLQREQLERVAQLDIGRRRALWVAHVVEE